MNCPNCSAPMDALGLGGVYGSNIEVDLCFACHALWLDKTESIHLAPRGTLDLFRVLHEHRDDPRHSLGGRTLCPRCQRRLSLNHDISKGGRFAYYACPAGHGRLTPFSEFLKEKQFVRSLSPVEQHRLRAEVKSVQCSSCGAPVDLATGFACDHCGSPITVLDADAVEKTLLELDRADGGRSEGSDERTDASRSGDPADKEIRARALAYMEAMRTQPEAERRGAWSIRSRSMGGRGFDLLTASIGILFGDL